MMNYLYRASNLKYHFPGLSFIAEVNFWRLLKAVVSCYLAIHNNQRVR